MTTITETTEVPLVVDLDGTLIRTDLLLESALLLIRTNPLYVFVLPFWLLSGGKAYLKKEIARRVDLDVSVLPYDRDVLAHITKEKDTRPLVLATASNIKYARAIQEELQIFDTVLASDDTNLAGDRKAGKLVDEYGENGFDYIGNSPSDLPVWEKSRSMLAVDLTSSLRRKAEKPDKSFSKIFSRKSISLKPFIKSLRIHQWAKNLLVFIPTLASPDTLTWHSVFLACVVFISFCLCASSVYLLNDMLDLEHDRHHHRKRKRPFAAGKLSLWTGLITAPLLLAAAFTIAFSLSLSFVAVLLIYYALTCTYSFSLKEIVLLDIFALSVLYTLRILAGTTVVANPPSFWLFIFSVCIFLSLALVKRYSELGKIMADNPDELLRGRGYKPSDMNVLMAMGVASGFSSCLVLALYIATDSVQVRYSNPDFLWGSCFCLLFWISRIWFLTNRRVVVEDPIMFALRDWKGFITIIAALAFGVAATLW